jgi:DNA processing protein
MTMPLDWPGACARTQAWLACSTEDLQHAVWTWADAAYPAGLLALDDPPPLLFAQGQLHRPCGHSIAIVGSRNPTPQGRENARALAQQLHMAGCCVVSGLALGIDGAAHQGALQAASPQACVTVAVVGTGLDQVYPRAHQSLARQVAQHGWVLSELPPGTPPLAHHFPRRNRLIAGLSAGVLVVEAAMKSGSLITADLALSQGKEVFAVPGSIHSPLSRGCHALLRQGAKLVETAQDVLEELTWPLPVPLQTDSGVSLVAAGADALSVLEALGHDPQPLDVVLLRSGLALDQALAALHALQHSAQVAPMPGGFYQRLKG